MSEERKNEIIKAITDVEFYPIEVDDNTSLDDYQKISFDEIASLGSLFAQIPSGFRTVTSTVGGGRQLYVMNPRGLVGTVSSLGGDGFNMLTGVYDKTGLIGNVTYNPVNTTVVSTMPINPAMLAISIALIGIEIKLDKIAKTQKQIISFLEQKNESELLGNLKFLTDVLNNYKFNYDNERYKTNMHIKALDIKQVSEQNIIFYRKQISEIINKKQLVHVDQQTDKLLSDMQSRFKYYKLAVYQYAFSSYVEVMLLENFDHDYLQSILKKISDYSLEYKELYTGSYDRIEHNAQTSVQSVLLKGLSKATKSAVGVAEKAPIISKSMINESILAGSEKLEALGNKKTEETMNAFIENKTDEITVFTDSITNVDRLYNHPIQLLFDDSNLYLKCEDTV